MRPRPKVAAARLRPPRMPGAGPTNKELSARRDVEDAERVRAIQIDAQRAATEEAAQALAEEQRLTVDRAPRLTGSNTLRRRSTK